MKTKEIAELGMLLSVAFVLSYLEMKIPVLIAVPGVKLGLANITTMFVLYRYSAKMAYAFMILRVLITSFVFSGFQVFLYSIAGGLLCILMMTCAKKCKSFSMLGISILGAVAHNFGQILVAYFVMRNSHIFYYFPVLVISGLISGAIIGYISYLLLKKFNQMFPKGH